MDSMPVVFDISSDEEDSGGDTIGTVADSDYDWISELLHEDEREGEDDCDDVVLVREIMLSPRKKSKCSPVRAKTTFQDSDDDCVLLDDDPDKPVSVEKNTADDSEDLLIVGEKGQIACRDYPHARHLCAKFLFAAFPHERHCHQCHCYVCDSLAPCIHWGNGSSNTDHCHATDKHPYWRLQRKNIKQGDKATSPVPQPPDTSLLMLQPQAIQVPLLTQPQNQISRSTTIRPCATSTNSGIRNLTNQRISQPSSHISRKKFNPHLVSQSLHNNTSQREGRHSASNFRPQLTNSSRSLKRPGSTGVALSANRPGCVSYNNHCASQYSGNSVLAGLSGNSSTYGQHSVTEMASVSSAHRTHSQQKSSGSFRVSVPPSQARVSSHPNRGSSFVDSVSSQPQVSNHLKRSSFANSVPSQSQISSHLSRSDGFVSAIASQQSSLQTNMGSTSVNSVSYSQGISQQNIDCYESLVLPHLQVLSQPNMDGSFVLPPAEASSQPNISYNFENSAHCQPEVFSQSNTGSSFTNPVCSENQVYSDPIDLQEGNESRSALDPSFSDFNPSWVASADHCSQTDNSPVQGPGLAYPPPLVQEFNPPMPENTSGYSFFPEPDPWRVDIGFLVGTGGFDACSPEAPSVDVGCFFDF